MKILIPGISGQLGRMVAERLHQAGHEIAGIDRRPWPGAPRGVKVHEHDIRKRQAEDVFRTFRPEAVVHMAEESRRSEQRLDDCRVLMVQTGNRAQRFVVCHLTSVRIIYESGALIEFEFA